MDSEDPRDSLPERVMAGTDPAARELDQAFREQLCRLVEREMNKRYQSREDPEDIIQSVFRTCFRRIADGRFEFINIPGFLLFACTDARNTRLPRNWESAAKRCGTDFGGFKNG